MTRWRMMRLDLFCMKPYIHSYLLMIGIAAALALVNSSMVTSVPIIITLYLSMLASSIFSIQEKNHLERLYGVLSVDSSSVVQGRYLFSLLHVFAALLVSGVIVGVVSLVYSLPMDPAALGSVAIIAFLFFCFITSFQLPLFFRWGYSKARFISLIPMMLLAIIILAVPLLLPGVSELVVPFFEDLLLQPVLLALTCLGISLLMLGISYLLSLRAYNQTRQ